MPCYGSDKVRYPNQERTHTSTVVPPSPPDGERLELIPAFDRAAEMTHDQRRRMMNQAMRSWLCKTPSSHTRVNYLRDLRQFLDFEVIDVNELEQLVRVHPERVAAWRDSMRERGYANATIRRKLTTLRSLFSYLQVYGYVGANPAHGKFVTAPAAPRDGKTVGLSPMDCRRLLDAPDSSSPAGIRDGALLGVLAFSACRVGELVALRVGDFRANGEHRVLAIHGKGGKERMVPLHIEAVERLTVWLDVAGIRDDRDGSLFRPMATSRGQGYDGFKAFHLTTRAVEKLVKKYARQLRLDPGVVVHSFRVTALTTARERGAEIIDLQDWAGHADPRTTLTYIRTRDRLSKSPGYILNY
jgi:integrase/recombinase XerD